MGGQKERREHIACFGNVDAAIDFATRMEMAVVNTYFKKREEHRVTYKNERDRRLQSDSGG